MKKVDQAKTKARKIQKGRDGRGVLFESIQEGKVLKKVVEVQSGGEGNKKKIEAEGMGFNIAMILARRQAIEITDSDEESADDDWEDGEEEEE